MLKAKTLIDFKVTLKNMKNAMLLSLSRILNQIYRDQGLEVKGRRKNTRKISMHVGKENILRVSKGTKRNTSIDQDLDPDSTEKRNKRNTSIKMKKTEGTGMIQEKNDLSKGII